MNGTGRRYAAADTFYYLFITIVLVLISALCAAYAMRDPEPAPSGAAVSAAESESKKKECAVAVSENDTSAILSETEDAGSEYLNSIIFLGDSTTYGLKCYRMLNGGRETTQVWTPASGTLTLSAALYTNIVYPETGTEMPVREAVLRKRPPIMIITLGINGISFMDETYFKASYTALIQEIQQASPDTVIILQSIFPVARSYTDHPKINNPSIREANGWIMDLADACGVFYLDTASALADSEGFLPENYHNGDGMHLNEVSFAVELEYIRCHAAGGTDKNEE